MTLAVVYGKYIIFCVLTYMVALSWSTPTTETSFKRSRLTRNSHPTSTKMTYGKSLSRLWEASRLCMISKYSTGTWSRQTYSWIKMEFTNLGTWMSVKWLRRDCCTPKLELPIMQVQKYGETSRTITSQIFGLLDVSCTKLLHSSPLSGPRTCRVSTKKYSKVCILKFQVHSVMKCPRLSNLWCRSLLKWDLAVRKYWSYP